MQAFEWLWPRSCLGCGEVRPLPAHRSRVPDRIPRAVGAHPRSLALVDWCSDCAPGDPLCPKPPAFGIERAFAVERYERPVGQAIAHCKRSSDRTAGLRLARLYAEVLSPILEPARPDALVPAPSTWRTRGTRGFSLASLLARQLSRTLGVPVVDALRSRARGRLARLSGHERRHALQGRIRSIRPAPGRVVLVDDVLTTGATAEAAATELLGEQTTSVVLATLAVVTPPRPRRTPSTVPAVVPGFIPRTGHPARRVQKSVQER